jgi:hypothetical protein
MRTWLPTLLSVLALIAAGAGIVSARQAQNEVDRLDDRVATLEEAVGNPSALDDLDTRLTDLEDADLDGRIYELENADLDSRLSDVEHNVSDICDAVVNTNTNTAIQEMVDNISFACP